MKGLRRCSIVVCTAVWLAALSPGAGASKCPPDSVKVGTVCVDLYEASVWKIPPSNTSLVKKVQQGKATLADLTAGGATQLNSTFVCIGVIAADSPKNFPPDGNWTPVQGSHPPSPGVYAVSIPGVLPNGCMTWFQANQACLLSGKRLLRNSEWQGAAAGTPNPGSDNRTTDCAVNSPGLVNAGSRSSCKSSWGVFDLVGNVDEWVADWVDNSSGPCADWTHQTGIAGHDTSCVGGDGSPTTFPGNGGTLFFHQLPGPLSRGGFFSGGAGNDGVFKVTANGDSNIQAAVGFRCAR